MLNVSTSPGQPISPFIVTGSCATLVTPSLTPSLTATATDTDGGTLAYTFQVQNKATAPQVASGTATATAGTAAAWAVTSGALANNTTYQFRVQAADDQSSSAFSAWTDFSTNVDAAPAVPAGMLATPCETNECVDTVPAGEAVVAVSAREGVRVVTADELVVRCEPSARRTPYA